MCPAAEGGGVGGTRWILAMRGGLIGRVAGGKPLTGQLPASQRERCAGDQPIRQNGKGLSAGAADATAHPDSLMLVVVGAPKPPSMTHNGVSPAQRTAPRQELQRNHPGSLLSSISGSVIKRITAGVKVRRDRPAKIRSAGRAFTLPTESAQTKKEYPFQTFGCEPSPATLAGLKPLFENTRLCEHS